MPAYADGIGYVPQTVETTAALVEKHMGLGFEAIKFHLSGPDPDEYFYEALLSAPAALAANTTYWLEIVQVGDPNSTFRWEASQQVSIFAPFAFKNTDIPDWQLTTFDANLAFQLSTVPEPSTVLLLSIGALGILRRRRKEV